MLFSTKDLLKMGVPMLIQHLLTLSLSLADTMMVSSAGEAAVSGVSLVSTLDTTLVLVFFSLTVGGTVVASQLLGRQDVAQARNAAKQAMYASAAIALLITVLSVLFGNALLDLLFGNTEPAVMKNAQDYFFYISLSYPAFALVCSGAATLRVEGKTTGNMILDLLANVLNLGGNALLIFGFHMGAAGAAISTAAVRILHAIAMLVLLRSPKNTLRIDRLLHYRPDWPMIRQILRIGVPSGIEDGMFSFGKLLTQSIISALPTPVIAANAVAMSLLNYEYTPGSILQNVMLPVVGRCVGADKPDQARYFAKKITFWGYICLWIVSLGLCLFSSPLISMFGLTTESAKLAQQLIIIHSLVAGILWPVAFILPSAFRASGDVKFSMIVSMASMWIFRVGFGYLLSSGILPWINLGIWGVWLAMLIDWIFRGTLYLIRYRNGKWLRTCTPDVAKGASR